MRLLLVLSLLLVLLLVLLLLLLPSLLLLLLLLPCPLAGLAQSLLATAALCCCRPGQRLLAEPASAGPWWRFERQTATQRARAPPPGAAAIHPGQTRPTARAVPHPPVAPPLPPAHQLAPRRPALLQAAGGPARRSPLQG